MSKPVAENKKARMRFEILETFSAGIELTGAETKSVRAGHITLDGSRVIVRGGEAYLVGAQVAPYQAGNTPKDYDAGRSRRLLLKKDEIAQLADAESKKGLTIVPLEVYNDAYVKLRVGIVRGKKAPDRREDLKKRDAKREAERILKGRKE